VTVDAGPAPRERTGPRLAARLPLWPTLTFLSVAVLAVHLLGPHATSWHFFHDAARLLVGDAPGGEATGLHLYRDRPDLQFGPLAVLVALPLSVLGPTGGAWAAMVLGSVLGLVAFWFLLDAAIALRPELRAPSAAPSLLAAGAVFVITWGDVAVRTAHIDDAIALAATAAALSATARGRGLGAAAALGLAAAAKPWAVAFVPLVLVPGAGRTWWRAAIALGLPALTWAPFVLAEPATLDTADFVVRNDPASVLRVLGVHDPTTPSWARPVQLLGGVAVATLVVLRGRWHAAVLAGVAWRLLLEPGAHRYYTVGLVLGALIVELVARPGRVPWLTVAAAIVLELTAMSTAPDGSGLLRAACVVAALLAAWRATPLVRSGR